MNLTEIENLLKKALERENYSILSIKFKTIEGKKILEITIDKEGGANLKDCERASKIIEKILDEKDLIKQRYYLVVFSKGIEE